MLSYGLYLKCCSSAKVWSGSPKAGKVWAEPASKFKVHHPNIMVYIGYLGWELMLSIVFCIVDACNKVYFR